MASIDRRPNGKYRARWREVPGGPQKTRLFARKLDAQRFLVELQHGQHTGTYVDPVAGLERFGAFAEAWSEGQDWKATTRQQWPSRLAQLVWALGDVRLADVDQMAAKRARARLTERYSAATATAAWFLLRAVMQAAVADRKIGRDPTLGLDPPKRRQGDTSGKVTPEMVPSRGEALALLAGAPAGWRAAIALGLAGLRVGEVLGMRRDRLALDKRRVTVDGQAIELAGKGVSLSTVKNEKVREITVSQLVAVELRRHLRDGQGGTWVELRKRGDQVERIEHEMLFRRPGGDLWRHSQFYKEAWAPALKAAGLPAQRFKFHALRHYCASTLLAEGCPLPAVAGYLGDHQGTVSTVYAHWLPDDRDVPANILDRVLAPAEDSVRTAAAED